jgi:hypothetical protein
MLGRRRRSEVSPEVTSAFRVFLEVLATVEGAKATLASAAPGGRAAGIALAEALMGFQSGLDVARDRMAGWQDQSVTSEWDACRGALEEAERRAERLRLGAEPEGYEQLYRALGDILEPLDAFGRAYERFQELGV